MQTIEQIQAAWNAMDRQAQLESWDEFTRSIDYGDQGYHPFYSILFPMWARGEEPIDTSFFVHLDDEEVEASEDDYAFMVPTDQGAFDYLPY